MASALTVELYNFLGVPISNVSFSEPVGTAGGVAPNVSEMITIQPNTPDTPRAIASPDVFRAGTLLQLSYLGTNNTEIIMTTPFTVSTGSQRIYFVNNNNIDFPALRPRGGDITPYLYSNRYQVSGAFVVYQDRYAPASSYDFGPESIVVALAANENIKDLTLMNKIVWDDSLSGWLIALFVLLIIIMVIIAIATVVVIIAPGGDIDGYDRITDVPAARAIPMYL